MENPTTVVDSSASASTAADAALTTLCNSIQALGRGFDVTSDMRLLYCKGASGSRLVYVDEDNTRDLVISHGLVLPNVSADIELSRGDVVRETTSVLSFHEVMDLLGFFVFFCFVFFVDLGLFGWLDFEVGYVISCFWNFLWVRIEYSCIFGILWLNFFFDGSVVFGLQEELSDRFVVVLFSFRS